VVFEIDDGAAKEHISISWEPADQRARDAWANRDDATRDAAYLMVIAATERRHRMYAVRRVQVGGRADYYVAPVGVSADDLEACTRLEISGVDGGGRSAVSQRLTQKIEQVSRGANFPAMAGVIGFAARTILLRQVQDPQEAT
jgi:hypothetical protein